MRPVRTKLLHALRHLLSVLSVLPHHHFVHHFAWDWRRCRVCLVGQSAEHLCYYQQCSIFSGFDHSKQVCAPLFCIFPTAFLVFLRLDLISRLLFSELESLGRIISPSFSRRFRPLISILAFSSLSVTTQASTTVGFFPKP